MTEKRLRDLIKIRLVEDIDGARFYNTTQGPISRKDIICLPEAPVELNGFKYCEDSSLDGLVLDVPDDANAIFIKRNPHKKNSYWGLYSRIDLSKIESGEFAEGIACRTLASRE